MPGRLAVDVRARRREARGWLSLDRAAGALLVGLPVAFNLCFFLLG